MTPKFWWRTLRNLASRNRPYFAHLALTHVCNLRCRFCHIPEDHMREEDTAGMKRIIDRLDRLGIAVLSISGGGEPLLRKDTAAILDYAAEKGLYTKITSNGTMPLAKYQELLNSRVSEIAVSLDGVRGNDLPYSHVGPKILESLRYLNDRLPSGKRLTINVTVSQANCEQVAEIVAFCTWEFPKARIWLNPVVVGQGKLRVPCQLKVNPNFLKSVDSHTLLAPGFYKQGCEDYYHNETYNWGCLAGELFFDIKPNGDFWICQDHPAKEPLNILDPEFEAKYRRADFSHRRACSGCTYSCYWMTQKAFEPRNWPGMAEVWWKSATNPADACRRTERERGWVAGLLHFSASRLLASARQAARAALPLALLLNLNVARPEDVPPSSALDPQIEVVTRMEQANAQRRQLLVSYRSRRRYFAETRRPHRSGSIVVEETFLSPGTKRFRVIERNGSKAVEKRVFKNVLKAEQDAALPSARESVDICRRNYDFTFLEYDPSAGAYVFMADPRTGNRFLFRGKIWVDARDFAIHRVQGEPAQEPSFWIRRTRFVMHYAKFGDFWFPVSNRTAVQLRVFGRASLEIDYYDYSWEPSSAADKDAPRIGIAPRQTSYCPGLVY